MIFQILTHFMCDRIIALLIRQLFFLINKTFELLSKNVSIQFIEDLI